MPKAKPSMTFWTMETAASSAAPRWPTKAEVTNPMENWKTAEKIAGAAMNHMVFDSAHVFPTNLSMPSALRNQSLGFSFYGNLDFYLSSGMLTWRRGETRFHTKKERSV